MGRYHNNGCRAAAENNQGTREGPVLPAGAWSRPGRPRGGPPGPAACLPGVAAAVRAAATLEDVPWLCCCRDSEGCGGLGRRWYYTSWGGEANEPLRAPRAGGRGRGEGLYFGHIPHVLPSLWPSGWHPGTAPRPATRCRPCGRPRSTQCAVFGGQCVRTASPGQALPQHHSRAWLGAGHGAGWLLYWLALIDLNGAHPFIPDSRV